MNRALPPLAAIAFVLVVVLAVVFVLTRQDKPKGGAGADYLATDFTYESGSNQVFAVVENGLAVASVTGAQLIDGNGDTVVRHVVPMDVPAVSAAGTSAAFYDVGGTALFVAGLDGSLNELEVQTAIIAASMNPDGFLTLCTEETGYKGLVTVYNPELEEIYRWYSGTGYLIKAVLSPDGETLAALTADETGATVHIFSLGSETEKAAFNVPDLLFFDIAWLADNRICILSQEQAVFLSGGGAEQGVYPFDGLHLIDYTMTGAEFLTLHLARYRTGNEGKLVTLDADGRTAGTLEVTQDIINLSAAGKRLLVYSSDGLTLYSKGLSADKREENVVGARHALLREKGDALLLYSYYAEPFSF